MSAKLDLLARSERGTNEPTLRVDFNRPWRILTRDPLDGTDCHE